MNIDFSPSFTVSCVCFVLDLQQPVSHLHRLSGVDWANESVCAWLCSGERGQYAVTSEQTAPRWLLGRAQEPTLGVVFALQNCTTRQQWQHSDWKTLEIVWQVMNNWRIFFIFNNTCEMKWHMAQGIGKEREKKKESQIELWMMNGAFYAPVSNMSRKSWI